MNAIDADLYIGDHTPIPAQLYVLDPGETIKIVHRKGLKIDTHNNVSRYIAILNEIVVEVVAVLAA
jgi:hypothetical protein